MDFRYTAEIRAAIFFRRWSTEIKKIMSILRDTREAPLDVAFALAELADDPPRVSAYREATFT